MDTFSTRKAIESIVTYFTTEEKVQEFLAYLPSVDWKKAIAEREYEESLRPCYLCGEWKDNRTFTTVLDRTGAGLRTVNICVECKAKLTPQHVHICPFCDTDYLALFAPDEDTTCIRCDAMREAVKSHNKRAAVLSLPATLTVRQWGNAVRYFNGMCAYCDEKPFQCIEHYLPLSLEGGTTAENCIPACLNCNTRKAGRRPDVFTRLFPAEHLARIRGYFERVSSLV